MAHTKKIQFYRNESIILPDSQNAISALEMAKNALNLYGSKVDGEITLVRYQENQNGPIKTMAGIYHENENNGDWTYLTEFDESNYYTKGEIDEAEKVVASALNDLETRKQDNIVDINSIREGANLGRTALQAETDPTVPSWAKQTTKPTYTASEVGAVPTTRTVNGKALTGNITLTAEDVGALPDTTVIPTKVSELTNDSGFTTNTGTITGITMNGVSKGTSGVVDLGTVLTSHQDISGKADKITIVEVSGDGDVTQTLDANKFYKFTGALTSLTLTINTVSELAIYAGKFTTGSGWGSNGLSIPATVTEAANNDEIAASKTYEFSIMDNVIVVKEV